VLGFAKYWGLCKEKIPHGWGNTRSLKCTIRKVPRTSGRGPHLREADDKCIRPLERPKSCGGDISKKNEHLPPAFFYI